ncbi:MAG: hypothetical protein WC352_05935, partial [Candidatus Omnitrophota bacterium]
RPAARPDKPKAASWGRGPKLLAAVVFFAAQAAILYAVMTSSPDAKQAALSAAPMSAPKIRAMEPWPVRAAPVTLPAKPQPRSAPSSTQGSFVLTGMTVQGEERMAIINDRIVRIGDELREGAVVKDIRGRDNSVVLDVDGRQMTLTL